MPKKLAYEVTQIYCCVPVGKRQWNRLMKYDRDFMENEDPHSKNVLSDALEKLGASDIEHNRHFGMNFFFAAESKEAADRILTELEKLIS